MKKIFECKEELYLLCKEICSTKHKFYKESINLIESHGAIVKINHLFYNSGKYSNHPNLNNRCALMIRASIYPSTISLYHAERTHVCQSYYCKVGTINQIDTTTYQLKINEYEDKMMTAFFKKYAKRLVKKSAELALQHRVTDVIANIIYPKRIGSSFNTTHRKSLIKTIIVIILLILLLLIRLATPTGYHPSLK